MAGKIKWVSIVGDSISTYEGFQPYGYSVFYEGDVNVDNELESVDDTWWKRVIDALGAKLCINNSYSGSTVTGAFFPSACSNERCRALHGEETPDLILIYMGSNDRGMGAELKREASPNSFYGAYRLMLSKLKRNYPAAKIVCATLLTAQSETVASDPFLRKDTRYDEEIRAAAADEDCLLADLASFGEHYDSLDGLHPTRAGHEMFAKLWLRALRAVL